MKILRAFLTLAMVCMLSGTALADLNDGLVAYYPFNGDANDESVKANHGTVDGVTLTEDRFGNPRIIQSSFRARRSTTMECWSCEYYVRIWNN